MTHTPDIMERWLSSQAAARISGLDFVPVAHPLAANMVSSITKGQASVFILRQVPQGTSWFLKKFAPSRRPDDRYLIEVARYVPGHLEFVSCTQRRLLAPTHFDKWTSGFQQLELGEFIDGCILTPKVPGSSWMSLADDLRSGHKSWSIDERLQAALNLARAVERLEAGGCSHRDMSGGNVFIESNGRAHLIDWDSLFHKNVEFQSNTTVGTAGYIAPFTKSRSGGWDAQLSWRPLADRFALGILIAEFLLIDHFTPVHEDGSLCSQAQLHERESAAIRRQVHRLEDISVHLAWQLLAMLQATTFETCPSPRQWIAALNHELRRRGAKVTAPRSAARCDECQAPFTMPLALHEQIRSRHRAILCRPCRARRQSGAINSVELKISNQWIKLICEHCQTPLTKSRLKANGLRERGKALLCGHCLEKQIQTWDAERRQRDALYPETSCSRCASTFRMSRTKLNELLLRGRGPLCKACFLASSFASRPWPRGMLTPSLLRYRS